MAESAPPPFAQSHTELSYPSHGPPMSRGGKVLQVHGKLAWACGEPSSKTLYFTVVTDEEESNWGADLQAKIVFA